MLLWLVNLDFAAGGGGAPPISDGDEVMVLIAPNGIPCTVLTETTTTVRVVITSVKQIHVLTEGGTPIKVTI